RPLRETTTPGLAGRTPSTRKNHEASDRCALPVEDIKGKLTNFMTAAVYILHDEDNALVRKCRNGEPAAFEPLVRRYERQLFNLAYRMLGQYEEAADATQTAFVKAYQHLETFDTNQRFFSWIYRILKNECLNVLRDRRPTEQLPSELRATGSPGDSVECKERRAARPAPPMALMKGYREGLL